MRGRVVSAVLATLGVAGLVGSLAARQAGAPLPPTLFPSTPIDATVTLQWSANPAGAAATSYQIHAGSGPGLSDLVIHPVPDGDLGLRVTAINGNVYTGVCLSGGPNCTFAMTRQ